MREVASSTDLRRLGSFLAPDSELPYPDDRPWHDWRPSRARARASRLLRDLRSVVGASARADGGRWLGRATPTAARTLSVVRRLGAIAGAAAYAGTRVCRMDQSTRTGVRRRRDPQTGTAQPEVDSD
jgi:hypothetical protein